MTYLHYYIYEVVLFKIHSLSQLFYSKLSWNQRSLWLHTLARSPATLVIAYANINHEQVEAVGLQPQFLSLMFIYKLQRIWKMIKSLFNLQSCKISVTQNFHYTINLVLDCLWLQYMVTEQQRCRPVTLCIYSGILKSIEKSSPESQTAIVTWCPCQGSAHKINLVQSLPTLKHTEDAERRKTVHRVKQIRKWPNRK